MISQIVHSINTMPTGDALFVVIVVSLITGYFCLVTLTHSQQHKQRSPRLTPQVVALDIPQQELHQSSQPKIEPLQFHQPSTDSEDSSLDQNENDDFKNFGIRKSTTSLGAELYGKKYGIAAICAALIIRFLLNLRMGNTFSSLAIPDTAHYVMGVIIGVSWILGLFIRNKRFLDKFVTGMLIFWSILFLF